MLESTVTLFALVLTRLSGLLVTGGFVFGHASIPVKVRGLIAISLAMLVTPPLFGTFVPTPSTILDLGWLMIAELAVGSTLGLGLAVLLGGLELAGDVIDQQAGVALAPVFNPATGDMSTTTGTLLVTLATATLLAVEPYGIEEQMLGGVLETFRVIPPGQAAFSPTIAQVLVGLAEQGIVLAVKVAAPLIAVGSLVTVAIGFLGASVPQINVFVLGFSVRAGVSMLVLVFCLGPASDLVLSTASALLSDLTDLLLSEG